MLVKSFDSTITNPKFIATHLNQTISLSNNNTHTHNGYLLYTPHPSSPYIEEELRTVVYNTDHSLTKVSSFEIPMFLVVLTLLPSVTACFVSLIILRRAYLDEVYICGTQALECLRWFLLMTTLRFLVSLLDLHIKTMICS